MNILVLGAGEIGTCLGKILERNHTVLYWDNNPARRTSGERIDSMVKRAECVFACVPSKALREALRDIEPFLPRTAPIVCLSKGIAPDGKLATDIIAETLPHHKDIVLMAGPMIAEELNAGKAGYAVCAGTETAYQIVARLFSGTRIFLEYTPDAKSVALCSALKNIYALLMGMADGMGLSANAKGYIAARIMGEWGALGPDLGIDAGIIRGTAGMADFLATSFSAGSHNRAAGEKVLKGEPVESEGTNSLAGIIGLIASSRREIPPLLGALHAVVHQGANPSDTIAKALRIA